MTHRQPIFSVVALTATSLGPVRRTPGLFAGLHASPAVRT